LQRRYATTLLLQKEACQENSSSAERVWLENQIRTFKLKVRAQCLAQRVYATLMVHACPA